MGYDHDLADRIRAIVANEQGITEQRMFGGLAFLVNGNMSVAASGQGGLLVRVSPDDSHSWADGDRITPMVMRGREMPGWLRVDTATVDAGDDLEQWVARGVTYAGSLPVKRKR